MLACVSIAPLATPVVPPVYCRNARSSRRTGTSSSVCACPAASASLNVVVCARCHAGTIFFTCLTTRLVSIRLKAGNMSPICVVMMVFTGVRGSTSSSVCAKFSSTTIAVAPESFSWCSSSRAV